jgi:hypothetical protein
MMLSFHYCLGASPATGLFWNISVQFRKDNINDNPSYLEIRHTPKSVITLVRDYPLLHVRFWELVAILGWYDSKFSGWQAKASLGNDCHQMDIKSWSVLGISIRKENLIDCHWATSEKQRSNRPVRFFSDEIYVKSTISNTGQGIWSVWIDLPFLVARTNVWAHEHELSVLQASTTLDAS